MFRDIKINKISNNIQFIITKIDLSIINGIRRTLMTDIPIVGFIGEGSELSINIIENETPLNNEILQNRISMIPIHLSDTETEQFDTENGIRDFEVKLNKKTKDLIEKITTKDLEVYIDGKKVKTEDYFPENKISKQNILITKLRKDETLHFTAKAFKKTAKLNASFNPVAGCSHYYNFTEDKSKSPIDNERDNYKKDEKNEPKEIVFQYEVINKLSHKYLFEKAIQILIEKIELLRHNIDKNIIQISKHKDISYDFLIENEDDTIGNIIQSYIYDNYVETKKELFNNKKCIYAGYLTIHPLQNILKIRISIEDTYDVMEFKTFLGNICQELITKLNEINDKWNEAHS